MKIKTTHSQIGVALSFILISLILLNKCINNNELENNSISSIAKVTKLIHIKYFSTDIEYDFFHKDKRYTSRTRLEDKYKKASVLNSYFLIKYSEMNPQINEIYLDSSITDKEKIKYFNLQ